MDDQNDRHYQAKMPSPGGKVYYRKTGNLSFLRPYQGPLGLDGLSKSTVSVSGRLPYGQKTCLDLKIFLSQKQVVRLKGNIAGTEHVVDEQLGKSIIQLLPFGFGRNYNSFKAKDILDEFLGD